MPTRPFNASPPGYNLEFFFDEPPTPEEEDEFLNTGLAMRPVDQALHENETLVAHIGRMQLTYLVAPTDEQRKQLRVIPVLRERRGTRENPVYIDSETWTTQAYQPKPDNGVPEAQQLLSDIPKTLRAPQPITAKLPTLGTVLARVGALESRLVLVDTAPTATPLVIAVIDFQFGALPNSNADRPEFATQVEKVGLRRTKHVANYDSPGMHGTLMAHVIADILNGTNVQIRRIQIPSHPTSSYLTPVDLAVAIAEAVAPRQSPELGTTTPPPADIILIPLSSGQFGTPPFLDAIVTAAAREGRSGKGAIIVCSTGSPKDNEQAVPMGGFGANRGSFTPSPRDSAAHGADELGAHPDVLLVGPCNLSGGWLRRYGTRPVMTPPDQFRAETGITGRMGPSVDISAPGQCTIVETLDSITDESSLASAIVAGVVGQLLLANPFVSPHEVRHLIRQTAMVSPEVDVNYGPEARCHSSFGRDGLNFKVGAGMVNALALVLASRDPFCHMLLHVAAPAPPPPDVDAVLADPALLIARWFDRWIRIQPATNRLALGYRELRPSLVRLLMNSWALREELGWIARHLFAVFTHDGNQTWFTPFKGTPTNHGALLRRARRLVRTLRFELERDGGRFNIDTRIAMDWANLLDESLKDLTSGQFERVLRVALLGHDGGLSISLESAEATSALESSAHQDETAGFSKSLHLDKDVSMAPYLWLARTEFV